MNYYRLYFFDPVTGHIDRFREFEARDDAEATSTAERWANGTPMELWSRERRLRRWGMAPPLD